MAGYIFALGKDKPQEAYEKCVEYGVYSTSMSSNVTGASIAFEGTLADYVTMKEGDNIYFFYDRKIYGVGELKKIGDDCKYSNYPESCKLKSFSYNEIEMDLLIDYEGYSPNYRWVCTFVPSPHFFQHGVDMDDVLTYKPSTFKVIRAFWKASFIKIGDEENNSLKEIILLRNQNSIDIWGFDENNHHELNKIITIQHRIRVKDLLSCCYTDGKIRHEMAIEAAILQRLSVDKNTIFGNWDYLSHQVPASPFKPIDYMDKMDIFAYKFLPGTNIISKYMVIEIKKEKAELDAVKQVAKYVDWICKEYAYGDYAAIEGYVVANSFTDESISGKDKICQRNYTSGSHPIENKEWSGVKLIKYSFDGDGLNFEEQV